jgi:uncharacterized protein (TIGR02453 family)
MLPNQALSFLNELRQNNNKEWFDAHRSHYTTIKNGIEQLAEAVIQGLGQYDPSISFLTGKNCMFRINRDVRFSADKSPYKTNMGFWMSRGGKKAPTAGYYVHLEPNGKSFIAAGVYMPMPPDLKKVRTEILYGFDDFLQIIEHTAFVNQWGKLDEAEGMKTSRVPQGFDAKHPSSEFLKFKSYIVSKPIQDDFWQKPDAVAFIVEHFKTTIPFVNFINRAFLPEED